jgi:2-oxoglutarate dehydrogenase E2 component (dihydrolipoamide succinyltransferase)
MATEVHVPPFPESVEEGTLTTWYKKEGEAVARDEKLADIETDKIVLEVTATAAGVLQAVQLAEGTTVKPGQVMATIGEGEGTAAAPAAEPETEEPPPEPATAVQVNTHLSPAVRRLVEEHDLDPADVQGSGRQGMITKGDVLQHLASRKTDDAAPAPTATFEPGPEPGPVPDSPAETATPTGRPERRVPMTRIRARIAERLVEAQQTAAILTTFNEINMQTVMDMRARHKEEFEQTHGVKLGFMSFFVKAAAEALAKYPVVNATFDQGNIVYHGYYDIGVAVSTERGLVVPILRDADQLSYAEIERSIGAFAARAREGKLTMEDLTGGTFSITNGGIFGSLLSTPILNPPQSAILGMHQIQQRPIAENGEVVIRPMMYVALSYDHRLIDGRDAVQFLVEMKQQLEDPARILLEL